jgi:leucyl-tRNA synthetase
MYNFEQIENKWRKVWRETGLFLTPKTPKSKFYLLEMFLYPSGDLHIGHFRNYSIGDVMWRYLHMKGYDLMHPFGWDAFGLPAEQAAIKRNLSPAEWTLKNIETAKTSLIKLGISYDWNTEIRTCDPNYYKWTQWIFLKLYESGLAYRDFNYVNWCPECKTVLANEQASGGVCWRCQSNVEKRELEQWYIRITEYAPRLLDSLVKFEGIWPNSLIAMQRNWIGRSEGGEFDFPIKNTDIVLPIFTTRPDTIYGVTFMSIAPDAKIMKNIIRYIPSEKLESVKRYIENSLLKSEIERSTVDTQKDGVFTGLYAVNPFNGELVQIWVADFVLASYGTGAVMSVPAHDQRDFEFAMKYDIPIKVVINPPDRFLTPEEMTKAYVESGIMINSDLFDGLSSQDGGNKVIEYGIEHDFGRRKITYKIRDWLISRQRYWGAPIPMIHCERCGIVPVPENRLPVVLPKEDKVDFIPEGRSPLADIKEFINTTCPKCGGQAKRDPDTMDTFVDSAWYHLRYLSAKNDREAFTAEDARKWLPIDLYIGGSEHATGHLIYYRFIHKVLFDLGYIPKECGDEPAKKVYHHGMVLDEHGYVMSKSRGNVLSPMELSNEVGADAVRVAMLFFAPSDKEILWSRAGVKGAVRFLERVERTLKVAPESRVIPKLQDLSEDDLELMKKLHRTIKQVTQDIEEMQFNTAIAALMGLLNNIPNGFAPKHPLYFAFGDCFIRILAPFVPFLAEELNQRFGFEDSVFNREFPVYDESLVVQEVVEIGVQINGKVRGAITINIDADESIAVKAAKANTKIQKYIADKTITKVIYVPGKILNFIAE